MASFHTSCVGQALTGQSGSMLDNASPAPSPLFHPHTFLLSDDCVPPHSHTLESPQITPRQLSWPRRQRAHGRCLGGCNITSSHHCPSHRIAECANSKPLADSGICTRWKPNGVEIRWVVAVSSVVKRRRGVSWIREIW